MLGISDRQAQKVSLLNELGISVDNVGKNFVVGRYLCHIRKVMFNSAKEARHSLPFVCLFVNTITQKF